MTEFKAASQNFLLRPTLQGRETNSLLYSERHE